MPPFLSSIEISEDLFEPLVPSELVVDKPAHFCASLLSRAVFNNVLSSDLKTNGPEMGDGIGEFGRLLECFAIKLARYRRSLADRCVIMVDDAVVVAVEVDVEEATLDADTLYVVAIELAKTWTFLHGDVSTTEGVFKPTGDAVELITKLPQPPDDITADKPFVWELDVVALSEPNLKLLEGMMLIFGGFVARFDEITAVNAPLDALMAGELNSCVAPLVACCTYKMLAPPCRRICPDAPDNTNEPAGTR